MSEAADTNRSRLPFVFSSSLVLQLMCAFGSFLGAFVLPMNFPELGTQSAAILIALGVVFLAVAALNVAFGQRIGRLMHWAGRRSRFSLPREGIIYLVMMLMLAVGGILGQSHGNRLLILFGMMAGLFVLNGWCVMIMLYRVSVQRRLPSAVSAGETFSVELQVSNRKPLISSRMIEVLDTIHGRKMNAEPKVTFVRIPAFASRSGSYQLSIPLRGVYRFGLLRLSSRFPIGVGERARTILQAAELIVHPRCGRLLPAWQKRVRQMADAATRARSSRGIHDDEFHQIRDFRTGDNSRQIHWRSTARRGRLMLREFEQQREAEVVILLDLFAAPEFSAVLQETAVSLAATLSIEQSRHATAGSYRLLIAGSQISEIQTASPSRFRQAALDALAVAEVSARADLASILGTACESVGANSQFLLITPRPTAATAIAESLIEDMVHRGTYFGERLHIVPATEASLTEIFRSDDADAPR